MSGYEGTTGNGGLNYEAGIWNGSNGTDEYMADMQYGNYDGMGDFHTAIDPALLADFDTLPADNSTHIQVSPYPTTSSSSISNLITQQQLANNSTSSSTSTTPAPAAQNHHTISPALLQTISKQTQTQTQPQTQTTITPAGRPAAASPKALGKKPFIPDTNEDLWNVQLVDTLTSKDNFNSSLSNVPNAFTKLVELLKVRQVAANTDPNEAKLLSRPRVVMEGEMAKRVFANINKLAPSRYLKAWAKDSNAMGVLAFYLNRTCEVPEQDSSLGDAMRVAQEVLVLLLKLDKYDYSIEVAADHKIGNLVKSLSKPNKIFEIKNRMESTDIKKLIRQVINSLRARVEAENARRASGSGSAASTSVKREATDTPTDSKSKKIKTEPPSSSIKTKTVSASASSTTRTAAPASSTKTRTVDKSFFDAPALAPAPSRTIPAKTAPRATSKLAVDAFGSTLKSLLGTFSPAGQAELMAAEKAAQQAVTPKVKLGPDGKMKPRRNVTFAAEADLEKIMWIEAREDAGHHVSTRDFDAQEGRVLKQHAVQEDQSWYRPEKLVDAPLPDGEEKIELFSEARHEWERMGEPKFNLNDTAESSETLSSAKEQNVQVVSVVWSGAEPTKVMTPHLGLPVDSGLPGGYGLSASLPPPPSAPQNSFIDSPYGHAPPPPGPPAVDVGALLQNLSSVLPLQQKTPAPLPPVATTQDLTSLLAGLQQQQHIQQPSAPWPVIAQQYQDSRQAYGYANEGGWGNGQADGYGSAGVSGRGRGGGGAGGTGGRSRGGGGNRVPPPQSSDKICQFYRREGHCKYGTQCIDQHIN